jgi:hypothetical protein
MPPPLPLLSLLVSHLSEINPEPNIIILKDDKKIKKLNNIKISSKLPSGKMDKWT